MSVNTRLWALAMWGGCSAIQPQPTTCPTKLRVALVPELSRPAPARRVVATCGTQTLFDRVCIDGGQVQRVPGGLRVWCENILAINVQTPVIQEVVP